MLNRLLKRGYNTIKRIEYHLYTLAIRNNLLAEL